MPGLLRCVRDRPHVPRSSAAYALGEICKQPSSVVPELIAALDDHDNVVLAAAVGSLAQFGSDSHQSAKSLSRVLYKALVACDDQLVDVVCDALLAIFSDPFALLRERLQEQDEEIYRRAQQALHERGEHRTSNIQQRIKNKEQGSDTP